MILYTNGYLEEYREAIRRGEIIAGLELITELDNLIADHRVKEAKEYFENDQKHLLSNIPEKENHRFIKWNVMPC